MGPYLVEFLFFIFLFYFIFFNRTGLKIGFGFSQIVKNRFYVKPVRFKTGFERENVRFKPRTGSQTG